MDFQNAVNLGYYFDRCIDLYFYDSEKTLLGSLRTPKSSLKPSITVKGEFIEGEYAISSYVSVQNMAYDVDINAVAYIDCHMYYAGLNNATVETPRTSSVKHGHSILFSVLYADQEKEPPNRAVRFQCTVAAQDKARFNYKVNILNDGAVAATTDGKVDVSPKGVGKKSVTPTYKLIDFLKQIAIVHNNQIKAYDVISLVDAEKAATVENLTNKILLHSIICDKELAEKQIKVSPGKYSIGELLRQLNCVKTTSAGNITYCEWKVCMNAGNITVSRIVPDNWRDIAFTEGYNTEEKQNEYFYEHFFDKEPQIYYLAVDKAEKVQSAQSDYVYLNYVKSAYRTETIIQCSIMYDDRIRPGSYCVIQGNAIMGRHTGRGGKSGSRLISLTNQLVLFRVTGGVNFEFSTTEDATMALTGVIVDENYGTNEMATTIGFGAEGSQSYEYESDID